jgi:hypothetical protein
MVPLTQAERREQRRGHRLLFLTVLFWVLLNFPLLGVADVDGRLAGVPVLYVYLLSLWVLVVALTGFLVRKTPAGPDAE